MKNLRIPLALLLSALGAVQPAQAQSTTPPDPGAELRRQDERTQALRQREEQTVDVKPLALSVDASRLPDSESPCFRIDHIQIHSADNFDWLSKALAGPLGDDSAIGKCLGAKGIALLTTPIVWLVEESIKMPDGNTQKVLVPRVYASKNVMLQASGALIMGDSVTLASAGDITNQGLIHANKALKVSATDILNQGGTMRGQDVTLAATQDVVNTGGKVQAQDSLKVDAGRAEKAKTFADAMMTVGGIAASMAASGAQIKPGIPNGSTVVAGELTGTRTTISSADDAATIRSLTRENESATTLAGNGYKVEQNPPTLPNGKNPDYIINGQVFDNYAPSTSNVRNAAKVIEKKVADGQADNVVVNLADSSITPSALREQLTNYPIPGLNKVIIIDKTGKTTTINFLEK